jgi:FkbM family methyltransferase
VAIGFDEGWHHRVGGYYVPDGPHFEYYEPSVLDWKNEIPTFFADATDFWFVGYSPKPGDVILDIGAGRGEDVIPFAEAVGPEGRVYAAEAHPASFNHLKRFCELNGFLNVIPSHAAIMDEPGIVWIGDDENWACSCIRSDGSGTPVQAITVDGLCREYDIRRIDFLKMNIEGAKRSALLGMEETTEDKRTLHLRSRFSRRSRTWRKISDSRLCRGGS